MSEAPEAAKKSKTEYTAVEMTDGRTVQFAGKRKVNKETVIDESKIALDGDVLQIGAGAVSIRMDFLNGDTRLIPIPLALLARTAGHGGEQKFGDELATTVKPGEVAPTVEDYVQWIDDLNATFQKGEWGRGRASGGGAVSGGGIVVQAVAEAMGKTVAEIKEWLNKKLEREAAKPEEERITRNDLYKAFRKPGTPTYEIIQRLEAEQAAKSTKVDSAALMAEMAAG